MDNFKSHKFIVWGFEHYNPLGIVRSLGEKGINPYVIIVRNGTGPITSASRYIKEKYYVDSTEAGYSLLIQKFGRDSLKPFIITSDDTVTSFLDERYDEVKKNFICFNAGQNGRISYFMNKNNINELAKKHRLNVPPTIIVKRGSVIPNNIEFPIITKAVSSVTPGWKSDVFVCRNKSELKDALQNIKSDYIILQKYIVKKNELCLDGFSISKGRCTNITIASNYNTVNESAYSNNMTIFKLKNEVVGRAVKEMIKEIGFEGIWSAEFLVDENNDLHFLEINFRNSTWSYAATCLGMNMVTSWSEGMLNGYIPDDFEKVIPDKYMAIAELQDFRDRVKKHKISIFKWLMELKQYDCKFLYNKNDMQPFKNEIKAIFKRKLAKLRK